jgi:hypothetical protein
MPMQQVEYEFPNPDKEENLQEVEIPATEPETPELEVEGAVGRETIEKPSKKTEEKVIEAGDVEIEVQNDTPPEDRDRERSEPPEEITNEELQSYSNKVKKRIQQFSRGYHDERRAKESAEREREALEKYAKQLVEENQQLKTKTDQSHNALIESARKQVESELTVAQQKYRQAYEGGETDAIIEAQQALNTAQIRAEKVNSLKPKQVEQNQTALQPEENTVQSQQLAPPQPEPLQRDEKAAAWADKNTWYGNGPEGDPEMTALAWGVHTRLVNEGVDPRTDEYYERIDARMRQVFPEHFKDDGVGEPEEQPKAKSSNVVAPATRSTSPNKVRLKQSEIAIAKRLGVPLEKYALQVATLAGKQNG